MRDNAPLAEAREEHDEIMLLKERVYSLERKVQEIMRNLHYPDAY